MIQNVASMLNRKILNIKLPEILYDSLHKTLIVWKLSFNFNHLLPVSLLKCVQKRNPLITESQ